MRPTMQPGSPLRRVALACLASALALTGAVVLDLAPPPFVLTTVAAGGGQPPNIVLITTDDQTLSDLRWMPRTRRLLGGNGARFANALSPHPLCCPARAEILTGQYAHNNGVRHNTGPFGGYQALDTSSTLATWLADAGYRTAFLGKFLNDYEDTRDRVPGWDLWNPTVAGVYGYYGYTMFNNGHPRTYPGVHNADLVGQETARYVRELAGERPFFIWSSHVAPHPACQRGGRCWVPPVPAARHRDLFADVVAPSLASRSFNEPDVSDKPSWIRRAPGVGSRFVNQSFRRRVRSLQSVDEAVARTVRALRRSGELADTLVVFTSDNGMLLGEHRLFGKDVPYEEALRVPLLVRGPGVPSGVVRQQVALTVDLAPTFLDLAGARAGLRLDGRSLVPVLRRTGAPGPDTVLIQAGTASPTELGRSGWHYRGVRTGRYTYARYDSGFVELYDRRRDPAQLSNVAARREYADVRSELVARTASLSTCAGASCRVGFGPVPPRR